MTGMCRIVDRLIKGKTEDDRERERQKKKEGKRKTRRIELISVHLRC